MNCATVVSEKLYCDFRMQSFSYEYRIEDNTTSLNVWSWYHPLAHEVVRGSSSLPD